MSPTLCICGGAGGTLSGYAINPARDFGPRLFTLLTHGPDVFRVGPDWWWVPVVGCVQTMVGGGTLWHASTNALLFGVEIPIPQDDTADSVLMPKHQYCDCRSPLKYHGLHAIAFWSC